MCIVSLDRTRLSSISYKVDIELRVARLTVQLMFFSGVEIETEHLLLWNEVRSAVILSLSGSFRRPLSHGVQDSRSSQ